MTLAVDCREEVEALHAVMEDWFAGRVPESAFDRIADALAEDFTMIDPGSERRGRESLLDGMRGARSSRASSVPPFEIEVENVQVQATDGETCLLTYEEWQRTDGDRTGRLSTALLRRRADAPGGVEWVHLHETWLSSPE